jgi:hypothetical protein
MFAWANQNPGLTYSEAMALNSSEYPNNNEVLLFVFLRPGFTVII